MPFSLLELKRLKSARLIQAFGSTQHPLGFEIMYIKRMCVVKHDDSIYAYHKIHAYASIQSTTVSFDLKITIRHLRIYKR